MNSLSVDSTKFNKTTTPRERLKLATRKRLIERAKTAFVKSDFKASTLQIAQAARIAHGTVFFHFKDRDELILVVVKDLVLDMTDSLYRAYKESKDLRAFLNAHFAAVRMKWPLLKALYAGFSTFRNGTKQEVISLLSTMNYYLIEAFNKWADHGLERTILWQGIMVYLAFLGDYMFTKRGISDKFIESLTSFMTVSVGQAGRRVPKRSFFEEKKMCRSCGMIFRSKDDYALADTRQDFCRYCTDEKGVLRSFDEVLKVMTLFLERTQGINTKAAQQAALTILHKNPAWKASIKQKEAT